MELIINTYLFIAIIAILVILLILLIIAYVNNSKQKYLYKTLENRHSRAQNIITNRQTEVISKTKKLEEQEETFVKILQMIPNNIVILGEDNKIYKTFQYSAKNKRYLGRFGNKYMNGQLCLLVNNNPVSLKLIDITDYNKLYLALNDKV